MQLFFTAVNICDVVARTGGLGQCSGSGALFVLLDGGRSAARPAAPGHVGEPPLDHTSTNRVPSYGILVRTALNCGWGDARRRGAILLSGMRLLVRKLVEPD